MRSFAFRIIILLFVTASVSAESLTEKIFKSSMLKPINSSLIIPVDLDNYSKRMELLESQKLSLTIEQFQKLIEWGLLLREESLNFHGELLKADREEDVMPPELLERFNAGVESHLALRQEILKIMYAYEEWDKKNAVLNHVTPVNRLKGTMVALAGAVFLCDNFALSIEKYNDSSLYRRLLNQGNRGYSIRKNLLEEIVKSYYSPENRSRLRDVFSFVEQEKKTLSPQIADDEEIFYLNDLIESSLSKTIIEDGNQFFEFAELIKMYSIAGFDRLRKAPSEGMNFTSKVFGNSVGLVQTRHGYLYHDKKMIRDVEKTLKPLDILLEQTPFRLTSRFIPGYFGHVAIWSGTESELKELKLWNHPLIKPYQKQIRGGNCIIEALRSGVELNSLEHFSDIDDILVLRSNQKTTNDLTRKQLLRAFRQLGKEYDFNFDVETTDKIVCSELAYLVFPEIKWPTEKVVGRATISPDNVAAMAVDNGPLQVICFYRAGKKVTSDSTTALRKALESDK